MRLDITVRMINVRMSVMACSLAIIRKVFLKSSVDIKKYLLREESTPTQKRMADPSVLKD